MSTSAAAAPGRRLGAFYVALALVVAVAVAAVIAGADSAKSQPAIAGGYDITAGNACLGPQINVLQSGQFVSFEAPQDESIHAKLRLRDGKLTGDATCRSGEKRAIVAKPAERALVGTVGGARFAADLKRDPPAAGTAQPIVPTDIAGDYALTPPSTCLATKMTFAGESSALAIKSGGRQIGTGKYADGQLTGRVGCRDHTRAQLDGMAAGRNIDLHVLRAGAPEERLTAARQREFGKTLGVFFVAVAAVMLLARLFGMVAVRIGQPRVMGEVVAGITLGPTILGAFLPELQAALFPPDIIPVIGVVANLGLIFYMFLVGLELDFGQLRGRVTQAAAISNASVALPMAMGMGLAIPIYGLLAPPTRFAAFAL